jgi:hypothetical protein
LGKAEGEVKSASLSAIGDLAFVNHVTCLPDGRVLNAPAILRCQPLPAIWQVEVTRWQ